MMKNKVVRLLFLLSLVGVSFGGWGAAPVQASTYTIDEPFDTNIHPAGWTFLGSADMVTGWLQLTPYTQNQAGAVVYDLSTFSPYDAFEIEFDYGSFGGSTTTHADGLTFFMIDGAFTPSAPGAYGTKLGYGGIAGAYFAVGLNEYGGGTTPNVAIWDATHVVTSTPASIETGSRATPKHVRITYSENHVSVWLAGDLTIYNYVLASPLPASVQVGFSASTGSGTNYHEIRNVVIRVHSGALYVKPVASGSGTCEDWANACTLQTALASAIEGQEIWVAGGVYKPTANAADREATFQLRSQVAVYGGFDGQTDAALSERDPFDHPAILSGDIDNNESQAPVITDLATVTGNTTNSYHVVTGADGATLDGFTLTAGFANMDDPLGGFGGGMFNEASSPSITNVRFIGNSAFSAGGGMYNYSSSPILMDVTFSENSATGPDGMGGGMAIWEGSARLTNVTFNHNSALSTGGGIQSYSSNLILVNATFSDNSAGWGGGIHNSESSLDLKNVTINRNSAGTNGGGIFVEFGFIVIANSILWGNAAPSGGAQIFVVLGVSSPVVGDSIVEGGFPGGHNILTADPKLGRLGDYGGVTQTIPLHPKSSALDVLEASACPPTDQRGVARPQGAGCDLGAFEGWVNWTVHLPFIRR